MKYGIETITPEQAQEYLEKHNDANYRELDERLWKRYQRDMLRGAWKFQGDPIKFVTSGKLYDGQHRLKAVAESSKSQKFLVLRDMPDEMLHNPSEDTGRPRSVSTHLSHVGVSRTRAKAAAARILFKMRHGMAITPTASELSDFVLKHDSELEEICCRIGKAREAFSPSAVAAAVFCMRRLDKQKAMDALRIISLQEPAPSNHPLLVARNLGLTSKHRKRQWSPMEEISMIFKAWEADKKGAQPKTFQRTDSATLRGFTVDMIDC